MLRQRLSENLKYVFGPVPSRSFGAVGLWARVIQHELDHLNGTLICDYKQPEAESCLHCPLELPAVLIEERKHQSRPSRRR